MEKKMIDLWVDPERFVTLRDFEKVFAPMVAGAYNSKIKFDEYMNLVEISLKRIFDVVDVESFGDASSKFTRFTVQDDRLEILAEKAKTREKLFISKKKILFKVVSLVLRKLDSALIKNKNRRARYYLVRFSGEIKFYLLHKRRIKKAFSSQEIDENDEVFLGNRVYSQAHFIAKELKKFLRESNFEKARGIKTSPQKNIKID